MTSSRNTDRIPLPQAHDTTFNGTATPRSIAKWEAEIHQIGRQMIGQLDSKMIALQTLTLDANRTANRLELLIEHLERLLGEQGLNRGNPAANRGDENRPGNQEAEQFVPTEFPESNTPPENIPNLLTGNEATDFSATRFSELLDDLENEAEHLRQDDGPDYREPVASARILKASELPLDSDRQREILREVSAEPAPRQESPAPHRLPSSIALTTASPIESFADRPQTTMQADPLALSSPGLPGRELPTERPVLSVKRYSSAPSKTPPTKARPQTGGLSIDSLYDDSPKRRVAVYDAAGSDESARPAQPAAPAAYSAQKSGSRLELRKQVEMLADYGYTANQIAQNLNITLGEVDLMLSLRTV